MAQALDGHPVSWLLASHHGSRYGTGGRWLDVAQPHWLLVSAGARNPFGHPHPDLLARAATRDITVLETAKTGAIQMTVGDDGQCRVQRWRERQRHYWSP
ncbi:MAG: hypothetical protein OIF57_00815 [Marinobacterium sp.]|nr:hypothetical protein [Marinobacterium sp.]